jgi:hypothetical protein
MRTSILLVITLLVCGCAATQSPSSKPANTADDADRWKKTDEAVVDVLKRAPGGSGATTRPRFGVTHIVLCWLKTPGDAEQRRKLIETAHEFHKIPGVTLIAAGTPIASTRPVVDSSYDVGFVMMFDDEAAMQRYLEHPQHRQAVADVLRPLTSKTVIYDFRNERP